MNSSLFEGFEGGGLRVGKSGLDAAFGKNPTSLAGLDQQEFNVTATHPVADRRYLFALLQSAQFGQPDKLGRELKGLYPFPPDGQP